MTDAKRDRNVRIFRKAMQILADLDPEFSIYVASSTPHLMSGPSHTGFGVAQPGNVVDTATGVRITGGDW